MLVAPNFSNFKIQYFHGIKVPVLGLGMVDYEDHKKASHARRCAYNQGDQAKEQDSNVILDFYKYYTQGEARAYFWNNDNIKVFITNTRPWRLKRLNLNAMVSLVDDIIAWKPARIIAESQKLQT